MLSKKKSSYAELSTIEISHKIISDDVMTSIHKLLVNDSVFGNFKSEILILYVQKKEANYNFCLSKTDYDVFKDNRPKFLGNIKGYSRLDTIPILFFGDINNSFFEIISENRYDILGDFPVYDKEHPPILYNPKIICFESD